MSDILFQSLFSCAPIFVPLDRCASPHNIAMVKQVAKQPKRRSKRVKQSVAVVAKKAKDALKAGAAGVSGIGTFFQKKKDSKARKATKKRSASEGAAAQVRDFSWAVRAASRRTRSI